MYHIRLHGPKIIECIIFPVKPPTNYNKLKKHLKTFRKTYRPNIQNSCFPSDNNIQGISSTIVVTLACIIYSEHYDRIIFFLEAIILIIAACAAKIRIKKQSILGFTPADNTFGYEGLT